MINRRHIIALAILIIIIMGYFLDIRLLRNRILDEVNASSLTPGLNASEVSSITISTQNKNTTIIKEGNNWIMTSPIQGLADPEIINQILTNVTSARKRNEITAKNLAEYGLAKPELQLQMKTSEGQSFAMSFGHASTYTGQVFAQVEGTGTVITVGEQVRNCLMRSPSDIRFSRIFNIEMDSLDKFSKIQILRKNSHLILEKQTNDNWKIMEPNPWAAEANIVTDWIRQCGLLKASGFITETTEEPVTLEAANTALQNPSLFVEITGADSQPVTLSVANAATTGTPIYVASRSFSREIITLTNSTIEAIDENDSYFRSRTIFTLKPEDLKEFCSEIRLEKTDLSRDDSGLWQLTHDKDAKIDQAKVNATIVNLLSSRVKKYVDLDPPNIEAYGLSPIPRWKYTITSKDRKVETLICGRPEAGNPSMIYAKLEDAKPVFTIDFGRELIITEDTIVDKHFMRPPETVVEIHLDINDEMKYVFARDAKGIWTLLKPLQQVPSTANTAKLSRMLKAFSDVTYDKIYRSENQDTVISSDLNTTSLKISYWCMTPDADGKNEKKETLTLRFGKRQADGALIEASGNRVYSINPQNLALIDSTVKLAID